MSVALTVTSILVGAGVLMVGAYSAVDRFWKRRQARQLDDSVAIRHRVAASDASRRSLSRCACSAELHPISRQWGPPDLALEPHMVYEDTCPTCKDRNERRQAS